MIQTAPQRNLPHGKTEPFRQPATQASSTARCHSRREAPHLHDLLSEWCVGFPARLDRMGYQFASIGNARVRVPIEIQGPPTSRLHAPFADGYGFDVAEDEILYQQPDQ